MTQSSGLPRACFFLPWIHRNRFWAGWAEKKPCLLWLGESDEGLWFLKLCFQLETSFTLTDRPIMRQKKQKGAYKLVNSLHGWVGLGPHRVEDGTTTFLSDSLNTESINQHRAIERMSWRMSSALVQLAASDLLNCPHMLSSWEEPMWPLWVRSHGWRGCFVGVTDLHGDQPLVVGLVAACGVEPGNVMVKSGQRWNTRPLLCHKQWSPTFVAPQMVSWQTVVSGTGL